MENHMFKTKIAVGITGRIVVLEKFPDDEKHAGLEEMLEELENDSESNEPPGVYMATMSITDKNYNGDPTYDYVYLDIDSVEPLEVLSGK